MLKKATLALFAVAALGTGNANAGTATGTFTVSATIAGSCTSITPVPLNIGTLFGTNQSATLTSTTINVTCSAGLPYTLTIDYGTSGAFFARNMKSGSNLLSYVLYTDINRTTQFGDIGGNGQSTSGGVAPADGSTSGGINTHKIFVTVPVQPTPAIGTYQDTLTATVSF